MQVGKGFPESLNGLEVGDVCRQPVLLVVYPSSRRPCDRPSVFLCVHTFKHEYLRNQ